MNKKMIFSVMIVLMAAAAGMPVMATGAQEGVDPAVRPYQQLDEKTLTGKVAINTDGRASLTVDGQEYELLYPYIAAADLEVETGDIVTVEGAVVPGPRWQENEDMQYLRVSKAVIDGKEYDLDEAYGDRMNGRRSTAGSMNGQARNNRPMTGPQGKWDGPVARGPQGNFGGTAEGSVARGYGAQPNVYGPNSGYGAPGQMRTIARRIFVPYRRPVDLPTARYR